IFSSFNLYILFAMPVAGMYFSLSLFYHLYGEHEAHFVAHYEAAGFGGGAPGKTEILSVDLAAQLKACFGLTPGVNGDAVVVHVQLYRFGNAADGEVAVQHEVLFVFFLYAGGGEAQL